MRTLNQNAYALTLVNGASVVVFGNTLIAACRTSHIHATSVKSWLTFYSMPVPQ